MRTSKKEEEGGGGGQGEGRTINHL